MSSTPWLHAYQADVLQGCAKIPDQSVDVAFFSPPYKKKDGYSDDLMRAVGHLLARTLRPGGRVWLNFGQLRERLDRPQYAARLLEYGAKGALRPGQTIAWIKSIAVPSWRETTMARVKEMRDATAPTHVSLMVVFQQFAKSLWQLLTGPGEIVQRGHYQPITSPHVMHYCWEPLFTFYRPPEPTLDRLSIGVPFTDKSNLKRGTRGQHGDVHCAGDAWFVPYETTGHLTKKQHRYEFPEALVERALKVSGVAPGGTVLDPFLGSGTTAVAAKKLGLNCYGLDLDATTLKGARRRWSRA